ncbi:MAG: hypothetical protein QM503_01720 [Bacteroidota bacterium]
MKIEEKYSFLLLSFFMNFIFVGLYVFQLSSENSSLFSTLFIPDGVIWLEQIYSLFNEDDYFKAIFSSTVNRGNALLLMFYTIPLKINIYMVFVVNLFVFNVIALHMFLKSSIKYSFAVYLLVPYFWISMALPSKDILVLFITYIVYCSLLSKRVFIAVVFSVLCVYVRDGYGVLLLGFSFLYWLLLLLRVNKKAAIPVCILMVFFLIGISNYLVSEFYFVARNVNVAQQSSNYSMTSDIGSYLSYAVRLYANLTNLAFRPQFFNVYGGVDVLAVLYWLSGVCLLFVFSFSVYQLVFTKMSPDVELSVVFVLVMLIMISFNPMIQPRYLFSTMVVWPSIIGRVKLLSFPILYLLFMCVSILVYMMYELFSLGKMELVPYQSEVYKYFL